LPISPAYPPLPAGDPVPRPSHESRGALAAVATIAWLLAADLLLGPGPQVAGLFGCPPFVAALFTSPHRTAAVAAASSLATAYVGGGITSSAEIVRVAFVVLAGAAAVVAAQIRVAHDRELATMGHIAEIAQLAVLRELPTHVGPAHLAVRYVSAAVGARVGGDFYEVVAVDGGGMRAVVGDVRGNGLGAVQMAGALVGAFRGADHDHLTLQQVVTAMEMTFQRMRPSEEDFATAVLVELSHDGSIEVLSCGHPAPFVLGGSAGQPDVRRIHPSQPRPPIGFDPSPTSTYGCIAAGERLLMFTDGITDVRDADGTWFDLEGAAHAMVDMAPPAGVTWLEARLRAFNDGRVSDDVTLLLIELVVRTDGSV
jgi:serine phosphatase RsbU (regulator of sigma subunit)